MDREPDDLASELEADDDGGDPLRRRALSALAEVIDPELGLGIVELGLVYTLDLDDGVALVRMTMTSPACPLGEQIVEEAEARLADVEGIERAEVDIVWDPPWTPARMSAAAREALGWRAR